MDLQPEFTFHDLLRSVVGDMAKAVSERCGETEQQRFARSRAAVHMIMSFLPRDIIEAMLAGHCVMLHEVMTADAHDTLSRAAEPVRRGPRSNIVGLNKAFIDNLDRLERYRQRPATGSHEASEAKPAETRPAPSDVQTPATETAAPQPPPQAAPRPNRAARRQAARAEIRAAATASRAAAKPAAQVRRTAEIRPMPESLEVAEIAAFGPPSPEAIAVCNGNPEAMAALQSGDPAGFARAMGIAHPGEAFLAAANTKGSPFDPQATGPWPAAARQQPEEAPAQ